MNAIKHLYHSLAQSCRRLWIRTVRLLITCLEADLRGRALNWLYSYLIEWQPESGRYARDGNRYRRETR